MQHSSAFIGNVSLVCHVSPILSPAPGQEAEAEEVDPVEALGEVIPGVPGENYPIYATPPDTRC